MDYKKLFDDAVNEVFALRPEAEAVSFCRGHGIYHDGEEWLYADNGTPCDDQRACKRCGRYPTAEGYDACLGYIDGAKSACCGHGVQKPYTVY